MTSHDEYIHNRIARSPGFAEDLAEARAELKFVAALAAERERLGLTQAEVAARAGMQQTAVARYEKAGRTPSLLTLWRLAGALNCVIILGPDRSATFKSQEQNLPISGTVTHSGQVVGAPS